MYLIRSTGRLLSIRDFGVDGAPVRKIGPVEWVPFEKLPVGHGVGSDGDLVIREVIDPKGLEEPVDFDFKGPKAEPKPEAKPELVKIDEPEAEDKPEPEDKPKRGRPRKNA